MDDLTIKYEHSQPFELVLITRDSHGNPTGKKSYITDSPYKLSQFYDRNRGKPKKKTKVVDDKTKKVVKQHGSMQSYVETTDKDIVDVGQWHKELDGLEKKK